VVVTDPEWLVDKSALVRLDESADADLWVGRLQRGLARISSLTVLELGYSARSGVDWSGLVNDPPVALMPVVNLTPSIERRAVEVQGMLADRGEHRAPSVPDVLVAASAELVGLVVLHLDKDFELIAAITGQPVARLVVP
jgi:predicted nucleic acid-binding protein